MGTGTMKHLLRGLLEAMNFQLGDKLLIVQINVGEFTELPRAVSHHMLLDPAPRACFKGACIHKAGDLDANSTTVGSYRQSNLLELLGARVVGHPARGRSQGVAHP